jgi:hypothetical protein
MSGDEPLSSDGSAAPTKSENATTNLIKSVNFSPAIMGIPQSRPCGPQCEDPELEKLIENLKKEDEYVNAPFRPVQEVLIHSFIYPKDSSNPASITSGVLTGGDPLWAFTVDEEFGRGELYYYVYDTKVIEYRVDGTWVVEHTDLVLVKAQIGVDGYIPKLNDLLGSAIRVFGGYTKFTPAMIHRVCMSLLGVDFSGDDDQESGLFAFERTFYLKGTNQAHQFSEYVD